MKALSIQQPWAWCICTGRKDVENRSWPTNFRGQVLVHAGKKFDHGAFESLQEDGEIPAHMTPGDFERGGIVGIAHISDCVTSMNSRWFFGEYGFVIDRAMEIPFKPLRGQLGFFEVQLSVAEVSDG